MINNNVIESVALGRRAFAACVNLIEIKGYSLISNGVVISIGERCFDGCVNLSEVAIHRDVNMIHDEAFRGCKSLKYFTVPNGNVELGENIFGDKTELKVMIFNGLPKNISKAFPKMKDSYTTIVLRYSMVSSFMSEYDYFALLPIRIDVETNGKSDLILVSTATDEDNEIFNYVWIETGDEALATQFSILSLYEENFRIGLNTAGASEDDIVVRLNSVLLPDNKVNKLEFPAFDFTGYCFDTYFKLGNYVIAVYDRTTGVDKIEPNLFAEKFDIYTVSGMCISRNFTIAKLNMMPKGIYILKSEIHTMKYAR